MDSLRWVDLGRLTYSSIEFLGYDVNSKATVSGILVDLFQRSINNCLHFPLVLDLPTLCQHRFRFFGAEPGRISLGLERLPELFDLEQEGFNYKFADTPGFPEHALRMNVKVEVMGIHFPYCARFLESLLLCCFTVGAAEFRVSLREGPLVAPVAVHQKKLGPLSLHPIANCRHLQWQAVPNSSGRHTVKLRPPPMECSLSR